VRSKGGGGAIALVVVSFSFLKQCLTCKEES